MNSVILTGKFTTNQWKISLIKSKTGIQSCTQSCTTGNKADIVAHREVKWEEGKRMADAVAAVQFVETSAKDNINVDTAFREITKVNVTA